MVEAQERLDFTERLLAQRPETRQIHEDTQEVHAAGTKAHRRNRVIRVDAWAWLYISGIVRDKLPTAYLFPEARREEPARLSRAHGVAVRDMKLSPALSLHKARHHWAVTHLRAGVPVAVEQTQLGHSTPVLTLTTYGALSRKARTGPGGRLW